MLGTQKGDKFANFIVRKRTPERRHLLSSVFNLVSDLFGFETLWHGVEGGPMLGSELVEAMAIGATFIPEENGSGMFRL